jgi:hypothetical protein
MRYAWARSALQQSTTLAKQLIDYVAHCWCVGVQFVQYHVWKYDAGVWLGHDTKYST